MPVRSENRRRLFELASTQAGYFTAAQAHTVGYSADSILHNVGVGYFERVARGFYRLREFPTGPYEDVIAAWVKVGSDRAVVSHDTALVLYELANPRSREIHLTVPREYRPRRQTAALGAVRVHTTTVPLRRHDIVQRFGVRVTSPPRTIVDAAEGGDPSIIMEATARALRSGLLTAAELRAAARNRSERVRLLLTRATTEAGARA